MSSKSTEKTPPANGKTLSVWLGLLWSILGGLLMFAAFPPLNISACVWAGLIPLLVSLWSGQRRTGKKGVLCYAFYGWVFGLVYFGGSFWWVNEVSTLGYIPFMMYLSLYPALWAALMGTVFRPRFQPEPARDLPVAERMAAWKEWSYADMAITMKSAVIGGALWVCMEWLRGWVMTGFGWNGLGVALYDGLALAQFAEYVGVTALSFIPAMTGIWLWFVGRRLGKMMLREGRRTSPWDFFVLCGILFVLFMWGTFSLNRFAPDASSGNVLPVLAVQKNYSQAYKWNHGNIDRIYEDMAQTTLAAITELQDKSLGKATENAAAPIDMPAWVIWPESSLPISTYLDSQTQASAFPDQYNEWFFSPQSVLQCARQQALSDFVFITGEDEIWLDGERKNVAAYNVMAAYTGDFDTRNVYRKSHLVPFGEYIPLRTTLPILEKAFEFSAGGAMGANFDAGTSRDPLDVPLTPGSSRHVQIIPSVCFEDTVGRLLRQFVRGAPQVIVNVTNDGWFNHSCANEQHWRNGAFRAIELRRSMIRAANTGVTVAIAPNGAVIGDVRDQKGSPFTKGYLFARLPISYQGVTLYAMLGDWAVALCALFLLGVLVFGKMNAAKR